VSGWTSLQFDLYLETSLCNKKVLDSIFELEQTCVVWNALGDVYDLEKPGECVPYYGQFMDPSMNICRKLFHISGTPNKFLSDLRP